MNDVVDRLEMLLRGEILLSEPEKRVLYREAAAEIEKLHAEVGDKYEDWSEEATRCSPCFGRRARSR